MQGSTATSPGHAHTGTRKYTAGGTKKSGGGWGNGEREGGGGGGYSLIKRTKGRSLEGGECRGGGAACGVHGGESLQLALVTRTNTLALLKLTRTVLPYEELLLLYSRVYCCTAVVVGCIGHLKAKPTKMFIMKIASILRV